MNKALLIIDVQKYFLNNETRPIVEKIRNYLRDNLQDYSVVYFTIFRNDPDSPLWQISEWKGIVKPPDIDICDEVKEFTNDKNLFYKNILSALKVPEIRDGLKENKIDQVDLCGFKTDCCVLATAYDLFDEGIKPVILEDLTQSTSKGNLHEPTIKIIKENIGFVKRA